MCRSFPDRIDKPAAVQYDAVASHWPPPEFRRDENVCCPQEGQMKRTNARGRPHDRHRVGSLARDYEGAVVIPSHDLNVIFLLTNNHINVNLFY
jgi:hypothetical protein